MYPRCHKLSLTVSLLSLSMVVQETSWTLGLLMPPLLVNQTKLMLMSKLQNKPDAYLHSTQKLSQARENRTRAWKSLLLRSNWRN